MTKPWPRIRLIGATIVFLLGCVALVADYTAIAAVAETRWAGLALLIAATSLFLLELRRGSTVFRSVGAAVSIVGVAVAGYMLWFAYGEQEVTFDSDGLVIAGTLYTPRWEEPLAAVAFVHGSGRITRHEFRWYAKTLARNGIAALIYDKRGAGESEGHTWSSTYHDYAGDAAAAVRYLRSEREIARVGLFGHSEGAWVAPIAQERASPPADFIIVSSGTPWSAAEQVVYETGAAVRAGGFDDETVNHAVALQERVMEYQRSGKEREALQEDLNEVDSEPWFSHAELPVELYDPHEYEWWRSVMDIDTRPYWSRIDVPVLAISGGLDRNSDVRQSQAEIRALLSESGNHRFTGVIFPRADHALVEWWIEGLPPPHYPAALDDTLVNWIRTAVE